MTSVLPLVNEEIGLIRPEGEDSLSSIGQPDSDCQEVTLFVNGVPYEAEEKEFLALFEAIGPIVKSSVPRWHDSGRLRGLAFITYGNKEDAEKAISALNNYQFGGRLLRVHVDAKPDVSSRQHKNELFVHSPQKNNESAKHPRQAKNNVLFVDNIPWNATKESVQSAFEPFGRVKQVRLVYFRSHKLKSYCFVEFEHANDAQNALNQNISMEGRQLNVGLDRARVQKTRKSPDIVSKHISSSTTTDPDANQNNDEDLIVAE